MYNLSRTQNLNIEKAIKFLIEKEHREDKPVIFHSLKVAFYLLSKGYQDEVILASILHDCLEDSDCTEKEIKDVFGERVERLVSAVSFNPKINDKEKRYQEMFKRTFKAGKKALIIKGADIYDNSYFYSLVKTESEYQHLIQKLKCFLELSKNKISQTEIWQDLHKQYLELNKTIDQ